MFFFSLNPLNTVAKICICLIKHGCVCVSQSQAASQEALDQIKAANEANLRSQLEQKIQELEGELGRARNAQQDSLNQRESTRTELERYHQLYSEELRLRKSLAAKLER